MIFPQNYGMSRHEESKRARERERGQRQGLEWLAVTLENWSKAIASESGDCAGCSDDIPMMTRNTAYLYSIAAIVVVVVV